MMVLDAIDINVLKEYLSYGMHLRYEGIVYGYSTEYELAVPTNEDLYKIGLSLDRIEWGMIEDAIIIFRRQKGE